MSGELGQVQRVEVVLEIQAPPDSDPRWSLELGGGATMDIGCYVLHAARQVGRWTSGEPSVVHADATLKAADIDAGMVAELPVSRRCRRRLPLEHGRRRPHYDLDRRR